jgi:hypothetical protein
MDLFCSWRGREIRRRKQGRGFLRRPRPRWQCGGPTTVQTPHSLSSSKDRSMYVVPLFLNSHSDKINTAVAIMYFWNNSLGLDCKECISQKHNADDITPDMCTVWWRWKKDVLVAAAWGVLNFNEMEPWGFFRVVADMQEHHVASQLCITQPEAWGTAGASRVLLASYKDSSTLKVKYTWLIMCNMCHVVALKRSRAGVVALLSYSCAWLQMP